MATIIPGKLIYLRTPHTGSTSVEKALLTLPGAVRVTPGHCTMSQIQRGECQSNCGGDARRILSGSEITATNVRDPHDLIVTWWISTGRRISLAEFIRGAQGEHQLADGSLFSRANSATFVLRFESLDLDFAAMCESLDLPIPHLGHHNATPSRSHWSSYHDEESMVAMEERFGDDIQKFKNVKTCHHR